MRACMQTHLAIKKCNYLPYYFLPVDTHFLFLAHSAELI